MIVRWAACSTLGSAAQRGGCSLGPVLRHRPRRLPVTCSSKQPGDQRLFGNVNRLSPRGEAEPALGDRLASDDYLDGRGAVQRGGGSGGSGGSRTSTGGSNSRSAGSSSSTGGGAPLAHQLGGLVCEWQAKWEQAKGRLAYSYFNWRQDTWSDLVLFATFNMVLLLLGGWLEGAVVLQLDDRAPRSSEGPSWWGDLYSVATWMLGENLPAAGASGLASQVFAMAAVVTGLVSFALVLALVEQVVLEVLESNVKRGSQVFEEGHLVVLAWGESAQCMSQLTRVLGQACHAYGAGGGVVVVMAQDRDKLEMESLFRKAIPDSSRMSTRFVFRQGSPLDPEALQMVAAHRAHAVIITSDSARSAQDSDAQGVRAAVLLDEMVEAQAQSGGGRAPAIILQIQNPDSTTTVRYACSDRVFPVPGYQIQARRICRIVKNPIVAVTSNEFVDFRSNAHISLLHLPSLVGLPFRDLHFYLPTATLIGLFDAQEQCILNPYQDRVLQPGEQLILLRGGPADSAADLEVCPLQRPPPPVDLGDWSPSQYTMHSQDEEPLGLDVSARSQSQRAPRQYSDYLQGEGAETDSEHEREGFRALHSAQKRGVFVLPLQYSSSLMPASDLLICGWGRTEFMITLLGELAHGLQALPPGTTVTLLNDRSEPPGLRSKFDARGFSTLDITHVRADPRSIFDLRASIDISRYKSVIVLADTYWHSHGVTDEANPYSVSQSEMLRMDAAVLLVQLNIRALLEERGLPEISIVVQRQSFVGNTRFEDATRLPLGLPVNPSSFIAKVLTQVAFNPLFAKAYAQLGHQADLVVQDSSAFAAQGEALSFQQLQARAASVHQVVVGWYRIPSSGDSPLDVVVNPRGAETRSQKLVWNRGDSRCKLVTLAPVRRFRGSGNGNGGGTSDSETEGTHSLAPT